MRCNKVPRFRTVWQFAAADGAGRPVLSPLPWSRIPGVLIPGVLIPKGLYHQYFARQRASSNPLSLEVLFLRRCSPLSTLLTSQADSCRGEAVNWCAFLKSLALALSSIRCGPRTHGFRSFCLRAWTSDSRLLFVCFYLSPLLWLS